MPDSVPPVTLPLHERLTAGPVAVLQALPAMGAVMVIGQVPGVTHERIGPVGAVTVTHGIAHLTGACHDAWIALAPIAGLRIDRSFATEDQAYPRIEALDAAGGILFTIYGMEGSAPFEAALAGFGRESIAAPETADDPTPVLADDDPAHLPFAALLAAGAAVTIRVTCPGVVQDWRGRIADITPAGGYLNLMCPDLHLHVAGGSIGGWQTAPGRRDALGPDGQPIGFTLLSEIFA